MPEFVIAQINIGRLTAPIDDPRMAGFVSKLNEINALAEASPGFIWRLQSESGNATDLVYNDDPLMIVNMSVWQTPDALRDYTYNSAHVEIMRRRREWFQKLEGAYSCLWWVAKGHLPSIAEGRERLNHYRENGATEFAFWFSHLFAAPFAELAQL